jgi:hypothetical protein
MLGPGAADPPGGRGSVRAAAALGLGRSLALPIHPAVTSIVGHTFRENPPPSWPLTAGRTKYSPGRTFNVVLDLILIRFPRRSAQRPMHSFGRLGLASFGLAALAFAAMLSFKYLFPWPHSW